MATAWVIKGDQLEQVKLEEVKHMPKLCEAIHRAKEELEGFLKYKHMSENEGMSKYTQASMEEFQHMLLALDDFFTALIPELNVNEQEELLKFFKAVSSR